MKMTDLRAKARAIFGSAIAEPMPKQPNGAAALQQRANARPIPTYKVGGVVKKRAGGAAPLPGGAIGADLRKKYMEALEESDRKKDRMPAAPTPGMKKGYGSSKAMMVEGAGGARKKDGGVMAPPARPRGGSPEADDVLITTPRGRRLEAELRRREAERKKAEEEKRARADRLLGIPAQKDGGKAGMYKKGGKAKDGLAVMIAIGKPVKEKATGERYASKKAMAKHEAAESAGMERMERMKGMKKMNGGPANVRDMNLEAGKVTQKMAAGGAGKVRKGQAPIKRAAGGAAKVRKGMCK